MSFILDTCLELFNFVASSVKTMFSATEDPGNVHFINSVREWQMQVNEAKAARKLIVAIIKASWCGACKSMAPIFVELSKRFGQQMVLVGVDVDEVRVLTHTPENAFQHKRNSELANVRFHDVRSARSNPMSTI